MKLLTGFKIYRVHDDVIVDVSFVRVGCHHKGVLALCPAHGGLIAQPIGFCRGDLTGLEGLPNLIGNDVGIRVQSCLLMIEPFG